MYFNFIKVFKVSIRFEIMDYEQLLENAYEKVKVSESSDRFDVPKVDVRVSGNRTTICNFGQIASYLRRDRDHVCKFLSKELAAYSKYEGDKLVFNRKISPKIIEEKIRLYADKFVVCQECKKPDTELIKKEGLMFIHCLACGAQHSLGRG